MSSCLFLQLIWRIPGTDCSNGYQNCCYTLFAYLLILSDSLLLIKALFSSLLRHLWLPVLVLKLMRPEWKLLLVVPWQSLGDSGRAGVLGCFFKVWGKALVNILSMAFVWLLHQGGQAPRFLIPEGDVVQCRKWEPINDLLSS